MSNAADQVLDPQTPCALCSLPIGPHPFQLMTAEKFLPFCCEGCRGIYQMLHDIKDMPSVEGDN